LFELDPLDGNFQINVVDEAVGIEEKTSYTDVVYQRKDIKNEKSKTVQSLYTISGKAADGVNTDIMHLTQNDLDNTELLQTSPMNLIEKSRESIQVSQKDQIAKLVAYGRNETEIKQVL
jgi:hypothetical protein